MAKKKKKLPVGLTAPANALDQKTLLDTRSYKKMLEEAKNLLDPSDSDKSCDLDAVNPKKVCDVLRRNIAKSSIAYVPMVGADYFFPSMLCDADIVVGTGWESWGKISDIKKNFNPHHTLGTDTAGNLDHDTAWSRRDENFTITKGTLGPLAVHRAIIAKELQGNNVGGIRFAAFDFKESDEKGEKKTYLSFKETKEDEIYDNMGFWITAGGKETLFLYVQDQIDLAALEKGRKPNRKSRIDETLAFMVQHAPEGIVMIHKAIPRNLYFDPNADIQKALKLRLVLPQSQLNAVISEDFSDDRRYGSSEQPYSMKPLNLLPFSALECLVWESRYRPQIALAC